MNFYQLPNSNNRPINQPNIESQYNEFYQTNIPTSQDPRSLWVIEDLDKINDRPSNFGPTTFEDENDQIPLLTELGIDFYSIGTRTKSVINPFVRIEAAILEQSDLAGPFVYFIIFGVMLLLSGKFNGFGIIYGLTASCSFFMYILLNLMDISISLLCTVSVIGYGSLPMVIAAAISCFFNITTSKGLSVMCLAFSIWSSFAATNMISTLNPNQHRYLLILFPFILIYGFFTAMIIFPY